MQQTEAAWDEAKQAGTVRLACGHAAIAWGFVTLAGANLVLQRAAGWRAVWAVLLLLALCAALVRTSMVTSRRRESPPLAFRVFWLVHPTRLLARARRGP